MKRVNTGNIITNGAQILSVGAVTASRVLGDASKTINNVYKDYKNRKDTNKETVTESPYFGDYNKNQIPEESSYEFEYNIRDADIYDDNSPQIQNIMLRQNNDMIWQERYKQLQSGGDNNADV